MKRNIALHSLMVVCSTILALNVAATAQDGDASCSFARAAGTYGFSTSGTVIGVGSRVSAGILSLDAAGTVTGKATSSLNGVIADETFSGTYTVNSDCTGPFSVVIHDPSGNVLLTVTLYAAWDDHMREFRGVFTSAQLPDGTSLLTVVNSEAKKR